MSSRSVLAVRCVSVSVWMLLVPAAVVVHVEAAVCTGGEINAVLSDETLMSGESTSCSATATITVGPSVAFQDASDTVLLAPSVALQDGVQADMGSSLTIGNLAIVQVRKTGQALCYDAAGATTACAGTGQDGDLKKGVAWPNPRFTNNGNGTVTDNLTGLMWMQDPECGTAFDFPDTGWPEALTAANGMANGQCALTDGSVAGEWRIPNVGELMSLTHFEFAGPALPNTAGTGQWTAGAPFSGVHGLPPAGSPSDYWTSTVYAIPPEPPAPPKNLVWVDNRYSGHEFITNYVVSPNEYVWMVKGAAAPGSPAPVPVTGQTNSLHAGDDGALQRGVPWPKPRFTDNGTGTVTDNLTGLVWVKDADCYQNDWIDVLAEIKTLSDKSPPFFDCGLSDGSQEGEWRLPNVLELVSLIHHGFENMALPNTAGTGQWTAGNPFVDIKDSAYWTSTTETGDPSNAWSVFVKFGEAVGWSKNLNVYALPVRDPR